MKVLTPMKAIRAKCVDCCCGDLRRSGNVPSKSALYGRIEWVTDPRTIQISTTTSYREKPPKKRG